MQPGLYDKDNNLIKTWNELEKLGLNLENNVQDDFVCLSSWEAEKFPVACNIFSEICTNKDYKLVISDKVKRLGSWSLCKSDCSRRLKSRGSGNRLASYIKLISSVFQDFLESRFR